MKTYSLPILVVTVLFSILLLGSTNCYAIIPTVDIAAFIPAHKSVVVHNPETFIQERIKLYEGFSATKYRCEVSGVTLQGYGKSLGKLKTPAKITKSIANTWLEKDIAKCATSLDKYLPWWRDLSTTHQAVMIDLTYNMGIFKLLKFEKFLKAMEDGNYAKAKHCLLTGKNGKQKSKYYKQVGIRALEIASSIEANHWVYLKEST